MTLDEIGAVAQLLGQLSSSALLAIAIIGLVKGWVVTSAHHAEVCLEKDERIAYLERKLDRYTNGG